MRAFLDEFPNVQFVLIPELEDNFMCTSDQCLRSGWNVGAGVSRFRLLREAALRTLGARANVRYRRNPRDIRSSEAAGHRLGSLAIEVHGFQDPGPLQAGDAISLDGAEWSLANTATPSDQDLATVNDLAVASARRGVEFLLWRAGWQGLDLSKPDGGKSTPVCSRTYRFVNLPVLSGIMTVR